MRTVVALDSREVKSALFVALNPIPTVNTVASAPRTSELIGYGSAFHPDIAIVEDGLSGRSLSEALESRGSRTLNRILVIGGDTAAAFVARSGTTEILRDVSI